MGIRTEAEKRGSFLRRLRRSDDGAALVEFALIVPFLMILTVGLVDIGRMMWYRSTLEHVAREGTRWAAVRGAGAPLETTKPAVVAYVTARTIGIHENDINVAATWVDNCSGCEVTVRVTMGFRFFIAGFFSFGDFTLAGQSTMIFS